MTREPGGTAPAWFTRALACRPERGSVDVDATRIRYRAWGDRGAAGLVLVPLLVKEGVEGLRGTGRGDHGAGESSA